MRVIFIFPTVLFITLFPVLKTYFKIQLGWGISGFLFPKYWDHINKLLLYTLVYPIPL